MGIFGTQKMLMCTLFFGGGGVSESVCLYTHEHVDIYGQPLISLMLNGDCDLVYKVKNNLVIQYEEYN